MSAKTGTFTWYDLNTTNTDAAIAFYKKVIGYDIEIFDLGGGQPPYAMWKAVAGNTVGGCVTLAEEAKAMGAPPNWLGYITVDSADASAAKCKELGGQLHFGPMDIPTVGRFAVCGDPHGASFALFQNAPNAPESKADPRANGEIGWRELMAGNLDQAWDFYSAMFGWQKDQAMDMGNGMGTYQTFNSAAGEGIGGIMTKPPTLPAASWLYYLNVGDINASIATAKENGGTLLMGPVEVPGGGLCAQLLDPQGAAFALYQFKAA